MLQFKRTCCFHATETLRKELEAHWMDLVKDVRNTVIEILEQETEKDETSSEEEDLTALLDKDDTVER